LQSKIHLQMVCAPWLQLKLKLKHHKMPIVASTFCPAMVRSPDCSQQIWIPVPVLKVFIWTFLDDSSNFQRFASFWL